MASVKLHVHLARREVELLEELAAAPELELGRSPRLFRKDVEVEKFLEPQGDGSFTVTWALDLQPCGEEGAAGDAKRRARHQSGRRA